MIFGRGYFFSLGFMGIRCSKKVLEVILVGGWIKFGVIDVKIVVINGFSFFFWCYY